MIQTSSTTSLVLTRLTPPPQQARMLVRQRMTSLLADITTYPLTLLVAPAGSGKTTVLADLARRQEHPLAWCRMVADESPARLLQHVAAACRDLVPHTHEHVHHTIGQIIAQPEPLQPMLEQLMNELVSALPAGSLLVLDDVHTADEQPELRALLAGMLAMQPPRLHLVLAARSMPQLESLPVAQARGEVLTITQADLAFTPEDTQRLCKLYDGMLTVDAEAITEACRGLPLALQLFAADLARHPATNEHPDSPLPDDDDSTELPPSVQRILPILDTYFAQQVLTTQPPAIQTFLHTTALLRWFDAAACTHLIDAVAGETLLAEVERRNLFLETRPDGQRAYQPLFRAFLSRYDMHHLTHTDYDTLHQRAAAYYEQQGDYEGALYHLVRCAQFTHAAAVIEAAASHWLRQGRPSLVLTWLDRLPDSYHPIPRLLEARARALHNLGHFEQSLVLYQQAEAAFETQHDVDGQVRSLCGCAEVYLDTVQPAPAVDLLDQALALLPADETTRRAEVMRMQAENWANMGRADIALDLEQQARALTQNDTPAPAMAPQYEGSQPEPMLLSRLLLRSGRLRESLHQIEAEMGLGTHSDADHEPHVLAHREPSLLLALLYTLLGNTPRAVATARRALLEAQQNDSLLTEAIAHMRVAHAYQMVTSIDSVIIEDHYRQSLALVDMSGVPRTKVESYMGLTLLHGHRGDLETAEMMARQALDLAQASGDAWIAALVWQALGGAATAAGDPRAPAWLEEAQQRFARGHDSYGQAVVSLWLALWYIRAGEPDRASFHVARLMELSQYFGYDGLLTAPTLFGPRDLASLIPLLLRARSMPDHTTFVQQVLRQAFPSIASDDMVEDYHPGYTLRIQMLGSFRVWRGTHEIQSREWQREKARQLLQLLLTYRGQWLQREQICSWLWPDSDLEAAERQFKVTLNALNTALEPGRPPRTMPFFVRRQGLAYSFAPSYGCWIDVDEFELRTSSVVPDEGDDFLLRNSHLAVQLYKGDYLTEALYDSWTLEERERLIARYLATATDMARRLLERGDIQQAVQLCEQVLRRDRCYEEAYQVMMQAYARSGSRSQALRTYARCTQALEDELGIEPLPETIVLYEQIKRNEPV